MYSTIYLLDTNTNSSYNISNRKKYLRETLLKWKVNLRLCIVLLYQTLLRRQTSWDVWQWLERRDGVLYALNSSVCWFPYTPNRCSLVHPVYDSPCSLLSLELSSLCSFCRLHKLVTRDYRKLNFITKWVSLKVVENRWVPSFLKWVCNINRIKILFILTISIGHLKTSLSVKLLLSFSLT